MRINLIKRLYLVKDQKYLVWTFNKWVGGTSWEYEWEAKDAYKPCAKLLRDNGINASWHIDCRNAQVYVTADGPTKRFYVTVKFATEDDQNMALMMFGDYQ